MQYSETELIFNTSASERGITLGDPTSPSNAPTEVLGIKIRIGNQPLVYNLKDLAGDQPKTLSAGSPLDATKDYYLVVHAIGAIRTQGKAKVDELQYTAESAAPGQLQTIDLIPNTKFKELLNATLNFNAALSVNGKASLSIPPELTANLIPQTIDIGGGMQLQLTADAAFIGKFSFSIKLPVVQATGVASDSCCWVLNPDENNTPLLGDQLLVQSIAVPKGSTSLTYKIRGLVKADKGLFWKQREKQTPEIEVKVDLVNTIKQK